MYYTALCMTMILDSEKLNPQYKQNSVLAMPWIAWGSRDPPAPLPLGYGPEREEEGKRKRWTLYLFSAGGQVPGQEDFWARFAVIIYDNNGRQFVFSARKWNNVASSYICQLQQQGLFKLI